MPQNRVYPLTVTPWVKDRAKAKEMIVYIAHKSAGDERFGDVKLNKILLYAEAYHLLGRGRAITGQPFQRLPLGPAARALLPLRKELEAEGAVECRMVPYKNKKQRKTIALREPNLTLFTETEIEAMDEIIRALWDADGTGVSNLSHDQGWKMIPDKADVPLETVIFSDGPLTAEELDYAREIAKRRKRA